MSKSMIHPLSTWFAFPRTQVRLRRAIFWNLAALLLLVSAAQAQNTSSVSGTVHDRSDALVPLAQVTLLNEASGATRDTESNSQGYFNFEAVPTGIYSVVITHAGFETWKVTGIEVHPGDSLTVPKIKMVVGRVLESVTVSAEAAGVTENSGEHSTLITSAEIDRLSTTGRDALELVSILPGFTLNAGTGLLNSGPDYTTTTFGSGNTGAFGANGSAPQQGLVNISTDGAQVIDPGDMGATVANLNMDQVQEVKVQTSNFGADEAKGPVVINAVGKSGGSSYHGSLYSYARNSIFNSNDWLSNNAGTVNANGKYVPVAKTAAKYFYPGGTFGGPVRIPGSSFNKNNHLVFWAGYEQYIQTSNANGTFSGPSYAFIPTPAMLSGDLSSASIASAFNVSAADLVANCTADYSQTPAYQNIGGDCYSPAGGTDQNGLPIPLTGQLNSINPAVATFTKFFPTINRVPQANNGSASDGYNWVDNVLATNNGLQLHTRVDENFSDNLKLFVVYNWEKVNSESPLNNIFYNPPSTIPYPTPLYSHGVSQYSSLNLTKVINDTTTNEVVAAGVFFNQPQQFGNPALAQDTGTPWAAAGYEGGPLKNGVTQLPRLYSWEGIGIPNLPMGYVPKGSKGEYFRKSSFNVADNLTKTLRTHTIKVGAYVEQTRNNQITPGSDANGTVLFDRYNSCLINQTTQTAMPPTNTFLGNTVGNFLAGCPGGYNQASFDPNLDMYFDSLEFYGTDEWKVSSKLTVTYGLRLSHLPPWQDSHGIGAAVWDPTKYNPTPTGVFVSGVTDDTTTWPGISWHKRDSSISVAGIGTRALFYSPRFGLAYDLHGNGKTVVRGGWGSYRSHDSYNVVSGALTTSIDLVDHGVSGNYTCTLDQLMNTAGVVPCGAYGGSTAIFNSGTVAQTHGSTFSVNAVDAKDNQQPVTYNYNFTLDQQLKFGSTLEIAYVGNQSTNLPTLGNLQNKDAIPLGAFFGPDPLTGQTNPAGNIPGQDQADYRPYPNYAAVNVPEHTNWANYNALQTSLNKQRGSLILGINYTWSKAMAVRGNYDTGTIGDPVNPHHDYGIVAFDRPQVANFTYSYQEGIKVRNNRILGAIANSWELSGVTSLQSGPDIAITNSTNFGFGASAGYFPSQSLPLNKNSEITVGANGATWLGSSDYNLQPTVTCNPSSGLHSAVLSGSLVSRQYANGNCFGLPAQGAQGLWNLPVVRGPKYFKSDLSVYKDIKLNDRNALQFRMSGFNFLNHPISSFTSNSGNALALTFADPVCNLTTGAGCFYSQAAAFSALKLSNPGFGYTPYKNGVRIVEFGAKYNF